MAIERGDSEYKHTLKDRIKDEWNRIHPPDVWINVPVTKDTVNERGMHEGDVVGLPGLEDGEMVVRPARIVLDARKSGDVITSLDFGGGLGMGMHHHLQLVLPNFEQEIDAAVDEEEKRFQERVDRGPDADSEWGRWYYRVDKLIGEYKEQEKEVDAYFEKDKEHLTKAAIAGVVGSISAFIQPVVGVPFAIEFARQLALARQHREKGVEKIQEIIDNDLLDIPSVEEVTQEFEAKNKTPNLQLTLIKDGE